MKQPPPLEAGLPRINPGYVHWLSRESMLSQSDGFISEVSGTSRIWKRGEKNSPSLLLYAAPTWLLLNPHSEPALQPLFANLASSWLESLPSQGISGLFISPTGENASLWAKKSDPTLSHAVTGFAFSREAGSEQDYERLLERTHMANLQLGGSLPPIATGIGPDFMLALRNAREFEGLYAAMDIPKSLWHILPPNPNEWEGVPLSPSLHERLAEENLIPRRLIRDDFLFGKKGGWAVTGVIQGVDGNIRRWLYYYEGDPGRPVLLYQDPSNRARKILSAAVIRHTGLERQSLAALSLEVLFGLEKKSERPDPSVFFPEDLEPGLDALQSVSQEIRRYGGWAFLTDPLPSRFSKLLLSKTDFILDSYLESALQTAQRTGNTDPLKKALHTMISDSIAQNRLVHGYEEGIRDENVTRFQCGLPGLLFLSAQTPGINLLPKRKSNPAQSFPNESSLSSLLLLRQKLRAAEGSITSLLRSPKGTVLLANTLPNGDIWLTAANFSHKEQSVPLQLPSRKQRLRLFDLDKSQLSIMTKTPQSDIISLTPKQVRSFLLGTDPHLP